MPFLSKSKYMVGLQCPRLLWHHYNAKDKLPPVGASQQALFDQGHLVGEYAKKIYPGGIDIPHGDFKDTIDQSKEALKKKVPIFEASFLAKDAYSRVDVLKPVGDEWDIIEVKSSTKVKPEHIHDISFQKFCLENSGLKIRKCFLMHINNQYERHGDIEPEKLFTKQDVTAEVNEITDVEAKLKWMLSIIEMKEAPEPEAGPQGKQPYECPLDELCCSYLPEGNVTELYWLGNKAFDLTDKGIKLVKDVPDSWPLTQKQFIQLKTYKTGKKHVDKENIQKWLDGLEYPLYFIDFETFMGALPFFDGTRPYQQLPFQVSIHLQDTPTSEPKHFEFLAQGKEDTRPGVLKALKVIGSKGNLVAYNSGFEIKVINELAKLFPEDANWLEDLNSRMKDLIVPFKQFWYHSKEQKGSCSLKNVFPALTGNGYEDLEVNKGDQASREWLRINYGDGEDREIVERQLLDYCELDTRAMIDIIAELRKII